MADTTKQVLQICVTTGSRVKDLVIKNGQLIFIQDRQRIAFDWNDKRTFYNRVEFLETEAERTELESPDDGYYFVIGTAVFWKYESGSWKQLTTNPEEIVFIGTELPELGSENTLYVDKLNNEIKVWNEDENKYQVVADKKEMVEASESEIDSLFI